MKTLISILVARYMALRRRCLAIFTPIGGEEPKSGYDDISNLFLSSTRLRYSSLTADTLFLVSSLASQGTSHNDRNIGNIHDGHENVTHHDEPITLFVIQPTKAADSGIVRICRGSLLIFAIAYSHLRDEGVR